MKKIFQIILLTISCLGFTVSGFSQEGETTDEVYTQLFNTYFEVGYIFENTNALGNGLLFKTGFEYRPTSTNSYFIRLNYDTYDAIYDLQILQDISRPMSGDASFTDAILGVGYRWGNQKIRFLGLIQGGLKFYNYPTLIEEDNFRFISLDDRLNWMTRVTVGMEYYFDESFAFSIDLFQNQVWQRQDFWSDHAGAWGFTFGLIGSFF
jgi:hypothetical protein